MKNFLKEVLKTTLSTYFASVVTGVGGVSSLIALFHDVSGYYVIYLCALLLFLSGYCFYLSKQNKANTKREETNIKVTKCSSVTSLKERTFNILAIDDQYKTRQYLKENFQSECLTVIEAIPTPLFAEGFDIIISDLIGAGPGKKENATQILQGIRKRYPYKYLIIMSSEPFSCRSCPMGGCNYNKD